MIRKSVTHNGDCSSMNNIQRFTQSSFRFLKILTGSTDENAFILVPLFFVSIIILIAMSVLVLS